MSYDDPEDRYFNPVLQKQFNAGRTWAHYMLKLGCETPQSLRSRLEDSGEEPDAYDKGILAGIEEWEAQQ